VSQENQTSQQPLLPDYSNAEIKAIIHNNSLRTYELSCIVDGILHALTAKGLFTEIELQNYVALSTAIKEWHIETRQLLSLVEAKEKFLGADYQIGDRKVKIYMPDFLPKDTLRSNLKNPNADSEQAQQPTENQH
jgi:hypothetical protein